MTEPTWRKSSFSGSQANCVELAASDRVLVRDTKNNSGAVLRFTPAAWRKFADQVKRSLSSDLIRPAGRDSHHVEQASTGPA